MAAEEKQDVVGGFAALYGDRLRRFLRTRVRNRADIPDLVQEVFLRLLRVPNHEMIRTPEAYIFTIAQHAARQKALEEKAEGDAVDLAEVLNELHGTADCDPQLKVSASQCLALIERNLRTLSPNVQATFLLHKRDGLTIDQVSARLGVSRPMAKKYLVKALVSFRKSLKEAQ